MVDLMEATERVGKLIDQANSRLKAGLIGASILLRGSRVFLQATLPPPPGSKRERPYQQQLAAKVYANAAGIRRAEDLAKHLGAQLALGKFRWEDWRELKTVETKAPAVGILVEQLRADYLARRGESHAVLSTWQSEYARPLAAHDPGAPLTGQSLKAAILSFPADSKGRARAAWAFGTLAESAGLDLGFDPATLRGGYSSAKPAPRHLPEDALVEEWFQRISYRPWATAFGVIAAFGLRPHEAFRLLKIEAMPGGGAFAEVGEDTKTGGRIVWALHPHWVDEFGLLEGAMPQLDRSKPNEKIGHQVAVAFNRYKIPFSAYHLRHAWAVRSLVLGVEVGLAARMMGHSVAVHTRQYHRWIDERHYRLAYKAFQN